MIVVFSMAATLWIFGVVMKTPHQARWIMIGLLFVGVLILHTVLPDGHPLREGTGGDARLWLLFLGFGVLALMYRRGLNWLKARSNSAPVAEAEMPPVQPMGDIELERYARHIVLREIGGPGQRRLHEAKVLVIGAGGLGSPVLQYLAAAGVGTIGIIDDDIVDHTNLQRQVIHRDQATGTPKVLSAKASVEAQNPYTNVLSYTRRLSDDIAHDLFDDFDLIVDGTDNFATRRLVNRTAVDLGLPVVSGALSQWEGQVTIFDPTRGAPCYNCLFPEDPAPELAPSCAAAGVLGPLPGIIGTMMAAEAIKLLTNAGTPLLGYMLIYDALDAEVRKLKVSRRPDCEVCSPAVRASA
ncbi:MAG: molybdopterin-synthase adenylyltransferase MoeB [Pseudomonadota bacterium]